MQKVNVFKTEEIKGYKVYYRNYGWMFEYLVIINGELYTAYMNIIPKIENRIGHFFNKNLALYSEAEMARVLVLLRTMAETTIETVGNKHEKN